MENKPFERDHRKEYILINTMTPRSRSRKCHLPKSITNLAATNCDTGYSKMLFQLGLWCCVKHERQALRNHASSKITPEADKFRARRGLEGERLELLENLDFRLQREMGL